MFNSKLKQRVAELETANKQLQEQYDLVHGFLLQRQDEVVALQRELVTAKEPVKAEYDIAAFRDSLTELKESLTNKVSSLEEIINRDFDKLIEYFDTLDEEEPTSVSFDEDDEDEDEGEEYDSEDEDDDYDYDEDED